MADERLRARGRLWIEDRLGCHASGYPGTRSDSRLPPAITTDVDQHANEPRFLVRDADRNRPRRSGGAQERLLHEIARVFGATRQAPSQLEQALMMEIEEGGDT